MIEMREVEPNNEEPKKFTEEDFTESELVLLKTIFKMADAMVEGFREDRYDVNMTNELYSITEKLGIGELVN